MTEQINESLERIRTDLGKLRPLDFRYSIFGAKSHLYNLNPILSKEALDEFEKTHKITLPEDYREYLTKVANGGAGPAYGVHTLAESLDNGWMPLGDLDKPFTLDKDNKNANYEGCLMISQRGCGGWTFLIVTGPMRGQVWYDDTVVDRGFGKASDDFVSWYQNWLTRSLKEIAEKPKDEAREFVEKLIEVCEKAPDKLAKVLDQEPDAPWLLAPLVSVAFNRIKANHPADAVLIYKRLFRFPTPEKGAIRTAYLEGLNNCIIAACMAKDFKSAVEISDKAQPFVEENPFIAHSAACAYTGVGDSEKALEQCRLAVKYKYPHLDLLEADADLAALASNPEFKKIFSKP